MPRQVILNFSDEDWDVMASLVPDPEQWVVEAVAGKINQSRKRLQREWIPRLRSEGTPIPANDVALESLIKAHPEYKDRATRDAEEIVDATPAP